MRRVARVSASLRPSPQARETASCAVKATAAQIGIHGFNGLDESVDGLGDHLLRTLLRHSYIRHVAVHGDHAREPPVFIAKRSAGGKIIAQLAIHQQGFGKAEGFARPVHGQRVGYKAARKLHIQLGIFQPAQLRGFFPAAQTGKALVGVMDDAVQVVEHYACRQGGIYAVHDLLLLVDHQIELVHLLRHGALVTAHKAPPQCGQQAASQRRHDQRSHNYILPYAGKLFINAAHGQGLLHKPGQVGHGQGKPVYLALAFRQAGINTCAERQFFIMQRPAGQI